MLARIEATIERYGMFARGQRVGVAVSGGADSVCLLHALLDLAPVWDLHLSVLHVNHRLRGEESEADAQFVRDLAARLGLEFRLHEADVRAAADASGDNLEQAARRVRQRFFRDLLRSGAAGRVAVGHTLSDQAETVLFRFLRGAGATGLAGIHPVTREGVVRPLIEIRRREVLEFLRERGVPWREDSSNQDRTFARNRIRHDLLPALERDWNPALSEVLSGTALVARDEEQYWQEAIAELCKDRLVLRPPAVLFRADWLAALQPAIARRALRKAVALAKGDLLRVDMRHIEGILDLARGQRGSGRLQIPALEAFRSFDWVRLAPPARIRREYEFELQAPGRYLVPNAGWELVLEQSSPGSLSGYNSMESERLDWGRISGTLRMRNWRPGDQYRPLGSADEVRVKSLFEQDRIPLWDRREWPVITCGDRIVWTAGFGPAADFVAAQTAATTLAIRETYDLAQFCSRELGRRRLIVGRGSASPQGGGGL